MKTLIAILAHQEASSTLARHWPYYELAGCDILGIGRCDKAVTWPSGKEVRSLIATTSIGMDGYAGGSNHLDRFIRLLDYFLESSFFDRYSDICVIEYDSIFVKLLQEHPGQGALLTTLAGVGDGRDFAACPYFHCPWWLDRSAADHVSEVGKRMLKNKLWERGFLDRWLGLMVELYGIQWAPAPSWSVNAIDSPEWVAQARLAIKEGAVFVHGIKTAQQLRDVTEGL
jgi:hypothetical protein